MLSTANPSLRKGANEVGLSVSDTLDVAEDFVVIVRNVRHDTDIGSYNPCDLGDTIRMGAVDLENKEAGQQVSQDRQGNDTGVVAGRPDAAT